MERTLRAVHEKVPHEPEDLVFPFMASQTVAAAGERLERRCKAVGIKPWVRMLQNLRNTASNEIIRKHGAVAESAWLGHSVKVASINYTRVLESEFEKAVGGME